MRVLASSKQAVRRLTPAETYCGRADITPGVTLQATSIRPSPAILSVVQKFTIRQSGWLSS